ncbi:MAG: YafY family protein [Polyangiales bacterium]|nr:YafY family transcriptional regulator [Myxococcales bacterium]MCB9657671.1 YafY family transcriptional regulator [Sandaracinaceae bacterium]
MRAQRLNEIIRQLRRARAPLTADTLAARFEVTPRTIYRDVAALIGSGVPIRGEAGVGYVLGEGYDLPPLMFDARELEALMLGARMVAAKADAATARDAESAIAKIVEVLPKERRALLLDSPLFAHSFRPKVEDRVDLVPLRDALRDQRKVHLNYRDVNGTATERTVWPVSLGYFEGSRALVAWCELRSDFRVFRTDRMDTLTALPDPLPRPRRVLLHAFREQQAEEERAAREGCGPRHPESGADHPGALRR